MWLAAQAPPAIGPSDHLGAITAVRIGAAPEGERGDVRAGVQHLVGELGVHPAMAGSQSSASAGRSSGSRATAVCTTSSSSVGQGGGLIG